MKTIEAKFLYQLQPNERWCLFDGKLVVVAPNHPPKIVWENGRVEEVDLGKDH